MFSSIKRFFQRHPSVREAILWVIPAILFGAVLRLCMLSYSPYAYWGSDSRSYFDFAFRLFAEQKISLNEKRRFVYPIYTAFVTMLPGSPLKWLAWIQHGFGLITLIPLAYVIRKTCVFWKWWIIPVTVLYAGLPVILWYEHEMLGETLYFAFVVWAYAGWVAWAKAQDRARAVAVWWWFYVPFALFILTKPSGRFLWPGLCLGLLLNAAWRRMSRKQIIALGTLMVITLFVGSKKQGGWLLYTATFPLTQLETPKHAEYKAQIRNDVTEFRTKIDSYYRSDDWPFEFLFNPADQQERPLWSALGEDKKSDLKHRIYMDLAIEGIKAHPELFLYLGWQRLVASSNLSEFKEQRFRADYSVLRLQNDYDDAVDKLSRQKGVGLPLALGYPARGPLPSYEEIVAQIAPKKDSIAEKVVISWVAGYEHYSALVHLPSREQRETTKLTQVPPTPLGCWLLAGFALSLALPFYRTTHGAWVLAALGYLGGVFLVSQVNPRYFGVAWPVFVPLLALPADFLCVLVRKIRLKKQKA